MPFRGYYILFGRMNITGYFSFMEDTFSKLVEHARLLSNNLAGNKKLKPKIVKQVIVAANPSDPKQELYLKAILQGHHSPAIAKQQSGATDFDLYVVFEGEPVELRLYSDCKPAFDSLEP